MLAVGLLFFFLYTERNLKTKYCVNTDAQISRTVYSKAVANRNVYTNYTHNVSAYSNPITVLLYVS